MKTLLKKITLLFILLITFASCDCCPDGDANGKITQVQAEEKHNLYLTTMESLGIQNNHEVNFTLEDLKKFICEAEDQAATLGINDPLGMRIYFGAINEDVNGVVTPKTTVFLTPTHKNGDLFCNTGGLYLNYGTSGVTNLLTVCP